MTTLHSENLVSVGVLARKLGISSLSLRAEVEAGRLPCVRVGAGFLFDKALIERLLLERARQLPTYQSAARELEAEKGGER